MQIKRLELQNFRGHRSTSLTFKPGVNVLLGPNGCGKSSVTHAIECVLTGKAAGIGLKDLINDRRPSGSVTMEVDNMAVCRNLDPHSLTINGNKPGIKEGQAVLLEQIGANERTISAVLHATELVDMDPKERAGLLFDYMGLSVDTESLAKEIPQHLTGTFFDQCHEYSGGAEVFDKVYKELYDARTAAKREKVRLESEVAALEKQATNIDPALLPQVEKQLAERKAQLAEKQREHGSIEQQIRSANELETRRARLAGEVNTLENERAELEGKTKGASILRAQIEDAEASLSKDRQELEAFNAGLIAAKTSLVPVKELVANLERNDGTCPLTKQPCADTDGLRKCYKESAEKVVTLAADIDKFHALCQGAKEVVEAGESLLKHLRQQESTMTADLARLDSVKRQLIAKQEELAHAKLTAPVGEMPDLSKLASEISDLQARVAKGEESRVALQREINRRQQLEGAKKKLAGQTETCEHLEELVKLFAPAGLKADYLKKAIAPVRERMAEVLGAMMFGWRVELEITDGELVVLAAEPGGVLREARLLSGSEKWRVSILIADVLNKLCGLGVLVLDEVDRVVTLEQREELYRCIRKIAPDYQTVLLVGACMDEIDLAWGEDANLMVWDGREFAATREQEAA